MAMNAIYRGPRDLPERIAVFPLPGALLLPRGQLPLNIFEPRYLVMVEDALKGTRLIGMIQPDETGTGSESLPSLYRIGCAGRITQFTETGDGRYLITLTGVARYLVMEELSVTTPYRQCRVNFEPYVADFTPNRDEKSVDRDALLHALAAYLSANHIEADWSSIREAPIEALVNGLAMMSPYGTREKQALLEAPDLKTRAEILVAVTEMALASRDDNGEKTVQ